MNKCKREELTILIWGASNSILNVIHTFQVFVNTKITNNFNFFEEKPIIAHTL